MNHDIKIVLMRFAPPEIHVNAGDTVTWHNDDSVDHHILSDTFDFTTDTIRPGDKSDPVKFDVIGHHAYHCTFHPDMHGWVKVA